MKQEYLVAAFDEMEKEYGTIENYFSAGLGIDAEKLVTNMIKFILEGISPVEEAPPLPHEYWEKLQRTAERRLTLAGYRIADLILSAAEQLEAQRRMYVP